MNLRDEIFEHLWSLGCTIGVIDGIVTVTTPSGVKWDFTIPQSK